MAELQWPGWEFVRLLGNGSFGTVYEIKREMFGRTERAALKIITIPQNREEIEELYNDGFDNATITARFQSCLEDIAYEYSLMAEMKGHTNIVYCDDFRYVQHDDGIGWDIYIKMELLTPLTKSLPKQISEDTVIRIGTDICKALVLCKERNIVHRDIKPQNIFVSADGNYKLGDFGIAKIAEHTTSGTKIGTYKYMAPEIYNNQPYGTASDLYSLGIVLFWLLNERRTPFLPLPPEVPTSSEENKARQRRFRGETLPAPAHGSDELKRIVLKACAFDQNERYASAAEMLKDLQKLSQRQMPDRMETYVAQSVETAPFEPLPEEEDKTEGVFTSAALRSMPEQKAENYSPAEQTSFAATQAAEEAFEIDLEDPEERTVNVFSAKKPEKETKAKKAPKGKKKWLPIAIAAVLALAVFATTWFAWIAPNRKYNRAGQLCDAGEYKKAIALYKELGGFRNSKVQIKKCMKLRYNQALELLDSGDYERAKAEFIALGRYKDAPEMVLECGYRYAEELFAKGDYENAAEAYSAVNDYNDAPEMVLECGYRYAEELFAKGDYENAAEAYSAVNDYNDANTKRLICLVRSSLQNDDLEGAKEYIREISDKQVKTELSLSLADTYFDAVDYENAARWYRIAGNLEMAKECLYQQAVAMMNSSEKVAAAGEFKQISGYKDADALRIRCVVDAANWYLKSNQFIEALSVLPTDMVVADTRVDEVYQLRNRIIEQLKTYNANNGLLVNEESLLGQWVQTQGWKQIEIIRHTDGQLWGNQSICSMQHSSEYPYYKFKNGIYYYGSNQIDWIAVVAVEWVDSTHIKAIDIYYAGQEIIELTKTE